MKVDVLELDLSRSTKRAFQACLLDEQGALEARRRAKGPEKVLAGLWAASPPTRACRSVCDSCWS